MLNQSILVTAAPRPKTDGLYATLLGAMGVKYTIQQQPVKITVQSQTGKTFRKMYVLSVIS